MDLYLLNENFEKIALIDNYESLIWVERYNSKGALDLQTLPSTLFKLGYFLQRSDEPESLYKITALEYTNDELIVGAESLQSLLYQRIIWKTCVFSGTAEDYIRKIITDNIINPSTSARKIEGFTLADAIGFTDEIEIQSDYENLGEAIEELCQTYDYGFKVEYKDGGFIFSLYQGKESPCVFSPEYENLGDTSFESNLEDFANSALVGGEGDGVARRLEGVYISAEEPSGLSRYEEFLDESSLSIEQETPVGEEIYRKQLQEKGREELKSIKTTTFEGGVVLQTYTYKKDYNLGDLVFAKDQYGNSGVFRIREITETWDDKGYSLEVSFDEN